MPHITNHSTTQRLTLIWWICYRPNLREIGKVALGRTEKGCFPLRPSNGSPKSNEVLTGTNRPKRFVAATRFIWPSTWLQQLFSPTSKQFHRINHKRLNCKKHLPEQLLSIRVKQKGYGARINLVHSFLTPYSTITTGYPWSLQKP